jgi:hypothetical protein
MDNTPNLSLPYILAAQAQKHVTHNEAIRALDAIVQLTVLDRDASAPPGSPSNGQRYIVASSPTGAWSGHAGHVAAFQDGAWAFFAPSEGWLAWIADEDRLVAWNGTAWVASVATVNPASRVGVNATADSTNKLSVKSDAVLLSWDDATPGSGDMRAKLNKQASANTASLLYQTGFSGRAEIGTTGDDKFHFKVSADGSAWTDAMVIDSSGRLGCGTATPEDRLHVSGNANPSIIVHNTNTAQFNGAAFALRGPDTLTAQAQTRFMHGNNDAGATNAYFAISQYGHTGSYVANLALYRYSAQDWLLFTNGISRLEITNAATRPAADNAYTIGGSGRRWSEVWAANGTIQTSDARDKTDVTPIDGEAATALVAAIAPVSFRWIVGGKSVVGMNEETGDVVTEDRPGTRRHAGYLAQDVKAALDQAGLDLGCWGLENREDPDSPQWIRPDQLVPLLWAAVRHLNTEVSALKTALPA